MRIATVLLLILVGAGSASAQQTGSARPFEIMDNSFLVEEAFNQEAGIFQNIFGVHRVSGSEWEFTFTQEWPLGDQKHQFSYIVPFARVLGPTRPERGLGDILLNYRYQALTEGPGRPAFAPRFSVILPSGAEQRGLGEGEPGFELNLPFSKQQGDVYWHWNAGVTWVPGVYSGQDSFTRTAVHRSLVSPWLAGSAIVRVRPMLNVLIEAVSEWEESPAFGGFGATMRDFTFLLSPGLRGGWNIGDHQLIVGVAVPVTVTETDDRVGVFGYFSYELPFKKPRQP